MNSYILKNAHLYRNGQFEDTDLLVIDGYIQRIACHIHEDYPIIDLKGQLVSHNFIDIHTHLREPGYEHKETIATGTLSALYGGYGTIVAMANTLPCMDSIDIIEDFQKRVDQDA